MISSDLRLASIWTGTNEVMSAITASEWYREYVKVRQERLPRNYEGDSAAADDVEEKVYE